MLRTITIAGQISAQGLFVRDHSDGRITISTGAEQLTGWPVSRGVHALTANWVQPSVGMGRVVHLAFV